MDASQPNRRFQLPRLTLFHLLPVAVMLHGLVLLVPMQEQKVEAKKPEEKPLEPIAMPIMLPPAAPSPQAVLPQKSPAAQPKAAPQPIAQAQPQPSIAPVVKPSPQIVERVVEKVIKQEVTPQAITPPPTQQPPAQPIPQPTTSQPTPPIEVPAQPTNPVAQALAQAGVKTMPCPRLKGDCQMVALTTTDLSAKFKQLPEYREAENLMNEEDRPIAYAFRIQEKLQYLYIDVEKGTGVATKFVMRPEKFNSSDEAFAIM